MYPQLVKQLKANMLSDFQHDLQGKWIAAKDPDIEQEITEEETRQRTEWARNYEVLYPLENQKLINVRGYMVDEDEYNKLFINRSIIRHNIEEKYKRMFLDDYWNSQHHDLKGHFSTQFDALHPELVLERFIKRHPWIEEELITIDESSRSGINDSKNFTSTLSYRFLSSIIKPALNTLESPQQTSWSWSSVESLITGHARWSKIDNATLTSQIEGFPLSNIHGFYYSDTPKLYSEVDSFIRAIYGNLEQNFFNYPLRRIDVLRHIAKLYPAKARSEIRNEITVPQMAPFIADELIQLSSAQIEYLDTILVNLADEKKPIWICIHKPNPTDYTQWNAYIPNSLYDKPMQKLVEEKLAEFTMKHKITITTHVIDYTDNAKQNDIDDLNELTVWHSVLFTRVLPWTQNKIPLSSLNNYRNKIPISLLLEYTLNSCLPYYTIYASDISNAFARRKPLSNANMETLYSSIGRAKASYLLEFPDFYDNKARDALIINAFDRQELQLLPDQDNTLPDTLKLNLSADTETLKWGHFALYHNTNITKLILSPVTLGYSTSQDRSIQRLFDYNTSIFTAQPLLPHQLKGTYNSLTLAMSNAARNRFLSTSYPLWDQMSELGMRPKLWRVAGNEMVNFYNTHGDKIDLDFINEFSKLNATWSKNYFNHEQKPRDPKVQLMWSFAQFAQMGTRGLDEMFLYLQSAFVNQWENIYKEPAPNLSAVFDLNGSLNDTPDAYTQYLKEKLKNIGNNSQGCSPIFKSLAFIVPNDLPLVSSHLVDIFYIVDQQKKKQTHSLPFYPNAVSEITLYNLNLNDYRNTKDFLDLIEALALSKDPLQILIRIPAWDRASFTGEKERKLKAQYHRIQNFILENQRQASLPELTLNTQNIHLLEKQAIKAEVIIKKHEELKAQPWEDNDISYPLATQTPGIQQQLQQAIEQEYEQEQEEQQEQEQEQEQEIAAYKGDEGLLITRLNIDSTNNLVEVWNSIPETTKSYSGWSKGTLLKDLFSLWVGSDIDAANVIKKMEPAAVQKIMEYAPYFRFGASRDNLPAGFYLAYSRYDRGLILCYDRKREKLELHTRTQTAPEKRDHFKVQMYDPLKPNVFRGDYRQFLAISNTEEKLLYKFLATPDTDRQRQENAVNTLNLLNRPTSPENVTVQMQEYTVFGVTNEAPGSWETCLKLLKAWAIKKINPPKEVLDALFDSANATTVLKEANLRAFGQLFYDHEVKHLSVNTKNASDHFLVLAQQLHQAFGAKHFETWKKYFLDPSQNYSELLTQDEITQVALSIATISSNDKKPLQNIWWALIEAHGKSTGFTRYGPLWESFQALLKYAEKNELILNEKSMLAYLKTTHNFNAQVFLDRLHRVLRLCERGMAKREIQQDILDHLDQIDWRHNGFYYAARYENHPYWDQSLNLSLFAASSNPNSPSYIPQMDYIVTPKKEELLIIGRRFISQRMKLLFSDFHKLNDIIEHQFVANRFINSANGPLSFRLLLACLSQGTDRISEFNEAIVKQQIAFLGKTNTRLLAWLNKNILLDGEIIPGSIDLKFEHITPLINAIEKAGIENELLEMDLSEAKQFINSCGRALKCYASDFVKEQWIKESSAERCLADLLTLLKKQKLDLNSTLLTDLPWLYFEHIKSGKKSWDNPIRSSYYSREEQQELLKKQMRSIDFSRTKSLPTYNELAEASTAIHSFENIPKIARQEFIKVHIQRGCAITYQDAAFRPLNQEEIKIAAEYMAKHLKVNFKSQNLKLSEQFFKECVAVEVNGSAQKKRLDNLLTLLASIDNKPYYNDLGQVFGLLIEYSKKQKGQQKYYSLEQLTSWLESLLDKKHMENVHYPINILTMILDMQLQGSNQATDSTLLHSDLNQLNTSIRPEQVRKNIVDIVCSEKLPGQYKPVLAKYALNFPYDSWFITEVRETIERLHKDQANSLWLKGISEFIGTLGEQRGPIYDHRRKILTQITQNSNEIAPEFNTLWEETQIKLIEIYQQNNLNFNSDTVDIFETRIHPSDMYIRMIILKAIDELDITKKQDAIYQLKTTLKRFATKDLHDLALYCRAEPIPSVELLTKLLSPEAFKSVDHLIHHFETVEQAKKAVNGRHYSLTPQDNLDLERVFSGLIQKGKGVVSDKEQKKLLELLYYSNNFSQVANLADLSFAELKQLLLKQRELLLQYSAGITEDEKELASLASARLLACMREILLRKTGKWVNHTQMLDLIYAARYNDEKLLHQVRTGQGKSIISMMRVAYLALNGKVVDIFSSKESLSKRDQKEFSHVLDAMGIRNSYITPSSSADAYQTNDSIENIGAVNFCTIGNFSLFQSTQIWQHIKNIDLDPSLRVAFIDECDFVLKFEDTQFNYSANSGAEAIYNFDEWVYRVAYKYYLEHVEHFPRDEHGVIRITRLKHLRELCELLQKEAINSPKQSEFLAKFINPAADGNPKAIEKRDNELKKLLVAAHVAQGLKEGRHYSIRPDQQIVGERTVINTRFAKVLIGNQIKHGSTYSDLVQQFLHVRLNEEAVAKGEAPNFFVEPDSTIALSSNAKYTLKKYYNKIEGCTGTAGNLDDLKQYEEIYGITHVVKLPSHEVLRTQFLGAIYSDSKAQQISDIVDYLNQYKDRPILVTCEDDIEVKKLSALILKEIKRRKETNIPCNLETQNFIIDTNDSGLAESDVVPRAGAAGKITLSSRMGRGTDIKPKPEVGLMVLRTYPALPQITKQESGRQGRNGALGTCIDIIDYSAVKKEYEYFTEPNSIYKERLAAIMQEQKLHLEQKFQKHHAKGSIKWKWLEDGRKKDHSDCAELQERYLRARSVQQLRYEIKKKNDAYLRRKEFLIASLSGDVIDVMHANFDNKTFNLSLFKENWLDCRKKVEALWNARLAGKAGDSEEVYATFIAQVASIWNDFCLQYPDLNQGLFQNLAKSLEKNAPKLDGPHDQVLKFIKDHIDILTLQKDQNKSVPHETVNQLREVKIKLRKIFLKYHPDKRTDDLKDGNPIYDEIVHKSGELLSLIDDSIRRGEQSAPIATEQEQQLKPQTSPESATTALITHKLPSLKPRTKAQQDDFKSVISFYQEWIKGTEKYYFSGTQTNPLILEVIYGEYGEDLDYFFESLYAVSHQGDEQKRTQLFKTLAELQKPQLFLIPAQNLANVSMLLSKKYSDPDFENYLCCLKAFFELKVLKEIKEPRLANPEDLIKFGLFFEMIMKIVSNQFVANDKRDTLLFMTHLFHRIYSDFWDDFNEALADDIVKVFAYSPATTSLFTEKVLDFDLYHFINLINHNTYASQKIRNQQIEQLGTYLDEHHKELADGQLGVMRPLFQMVLGETHNANKKEPYLHEPRLLKGLPKELQKDFWTFISQRQPVSQKDLNCLVDILRDGVDTKEFKSTVFSPLIALPPYITVEYIAEHLKGKISLTNLADAKRSLLELKQAAEAFNKYAHQVGIIESEHSFSQNAHLMYPEFVRLFNELTPEQNELFFSLCAKKKYINVSLQSIILLARTWNSGTIHGAELGKHLELAADISLLPESWNDSVITQYNNALINPGSMPRIQQFMSKLNGTGINSSMMESLWNAWETDAITTEKELDTSIQFAKKAQESHVLKEDLIKQIFKEWLKDIEKDEQMLEQALKIIQEIAALQTKYPELNELDKFMQSNKKDAKLREKYLQFFAAVKDKEINAATMAKLMPAWLSGKIPNFKLLQKSITTIEIAQDLHANKPEHKWTDYFSHFNKNSRIRQNLMQLLYHGILDLGRAFADKCYECYEKMVKREIQLPDTLSHLDLMTRRQVLTSNHRKIVAFTEEIKRMEQEIVHNDTKESPLGGIGEYKTFFAKQQETYNKEWWKNYDRKKQANTLFENLRTIRDFKRTEFFKAALDKIWASQKQILESDKKTNRNTKGYSRLYDITVHMSIYIASEFIKDPQISIADKTWLHQRMQDQMEYHIQLLRDRLPNTHEYKKLFGGYNKDNMIPNSIEFMEFVEGVRTIRLEKIPENLHYLVTNIGYFIDISEQAPVASSMQNKVTMV